MQINKASIMRMSMSAGMVAFIGMPVLAQEGEGGATGGRKMSLFEMFFTSSDPIGLIVTWLLILMSVAVMALVIHALLKNRKSEMMPEDLVDELAEMIEERRFREAIEVAGEEESMFAQIVHSALSEASSGYGAMQRAVEETTDMLATKRARGLAILEVMGAVGPMIGLFGTVYGMIVAFKVIVEKGGSPDPVDLAAGISTALVTTLWGLVVGIPAVAAVALLKNKIDGTAMECMIQAEEIIAQFRPSSKKSSSGSSRSKPAPAVK